MHKLDPHHTAPELLQFDSATLFESAANPGTMNGLQRVSGSGRIVGPALTVACPPGDNLMIHAAVAESRPGEILVVQTHDPSFGVWGEVLMTAALARGLAALVIDGGVRDLEALRETDFTVFARGLALRGAAKRRRGLVRKPISCGGLLVWPGDIVVADDSGVLVLDPGEVDATLTAARQRQAKETALMAGLQEKGTTVDLLDLAPALKVIGHNVPVSG